MQNPSKLTLALILLFPFFTHAQDTTWVDYAGKPAKVKIAVCYQTKEKTDSGYLVTLHYRNGNLARIGLYADEDLKVRQGAFRDYIMDGTLYRLQTFVNDNVNGLYIVYYENGVEKVRGTLVGDHRQGEWQVRFPSGAIAGKAMFKDDKQITRTLYKEDGSINTQDTIFYRDAEYVGGPRKYLRWLEKTLKYPDAALQQKIQGSVIVKFWIAKDGKAHDFKILQSVNPELDAEALRVLNQMPDWHPAIIAGIPIDYYALQPVVFRL